MTPDTTCDERGRISEDGREEFNFKFWVNEKRGR
jgi:hypothetical protein